MKKNEKIQEERRELSLRIRVLEEKESLSSFEEVLLDQLKLEKAKVEREYDNIIDERLKVLSQLC